MMTGIAGVLWANRWVLFPSAGISGRIRDVVKLVSFMYLFPDEASSKCFAESGISIKKHSKHFIKGLHESYHVILSVP